MKCKTCIHEYEIKKISNLTHNFLPVFEVFCLDTNVFSGRYSARTYREVKEQLTEEDFQADYCRRHEEALMRSSNEY